MLMDGKIAQSESKQTRRDRLRQQVCFEMVVPIDGKAVRFDSERCPQDKPC